MTLDITKAQEDINTLYADSTHYYEGEYHQAEHKRLTAFIDEAESLTSQVQKLTVERDALRDIFNKQQDALSDKWFITESEQLATLASQVQKLQTERDALINALTPSGETKADYIGEFKFNLMREGYDDEGEYREWSEVTYVPWDTTKDIMKAILARALTKDNTDNG